MQKVRGQVGPGKGNRVWDPPAGLLHGLGLVVLCLVVYLPGLWSIPPVDRDESRFAQASRQMFESVALPAAQLDPARHGGGLLVPMVQDRPRLNKPPLIYWLQAGSAAVFTGGDPMGDAIWMYRVPSLLAAVAAVLLTWRIGSSMFGGGVGLMAGAMLAVCPMVAWEAHQARADMLLLAWTVGAMGAMWGVWGGEKAGSDGERKRRRGGETESDRSWAHGAAFWVCIAGGVMTKGPITPMVAALAAVGVSLATREWKWVWRLRPGLGLLVVALVVGPWVVGVAQRVGWDEYGRTVWNETIGRSVSAREGHWGPPGYHLVLLTALFWPGSLMTGWGVVRAWKAAMGRGQKSRDRERGEPASPLHAGDFAPLRSRLRGTAGDPLLFCLAWVIPSWIVFELVGTKLPHYVLPLYPALAIVSGWALASIGSMAGAMRGGGVIWGLVGAGLMLLPGILADARMGDGPAQLARVASIVFVVILSKCGLHAWKGMVREAMRFAMVLMAVMAAVLLGVVLPRSRAVWVSRDVGEFVGRWIADGTHPIAAAGYHEDSLVFWTRGRLEKIEEADAGRWVAANPTGILVHALKAGETAPGERVFEGVNYSNGKRVRLGVRVPGGAP